jgi:hypothetical protein
MFILKMMDLIEKHRRDNVLLQETEEIVRGYFRNYAQTWVDVAVYGLKDYEICKILENFLME